MNPDRINWTLIDLSLMTLYTMKATEKEKEISKLKEHITGTTHNTKHNAIYKELDSQYSDARVKTTLTKTKTLPAPGVSRLTTRQDQVKLRVETQNKKRQIYFKQRFRSQSSCQLLQPFTFVLWSRVKMLSGPHILDNAALDGLISDVLRKNS